MTASNPWMNLTGRGFGVDWNDNDPAALTRESMALVLNNQISLAIIVVYFYDWIISLPLEITEIWAQRLTYTKALYFGTRYINWVFWGLQFVQLFGFVGSRDPDLNKTCNDLYISSSVFGIVGRLTSMGLFTLRTWAIYRERMTVLISLVLLALSSFALNMAALFGRATLVTESVSTTRTIVYSSPYGYLGGPCGTADTRLKASITWYPAVAWGSLLFSAIVFILTLVKTMKASRSARAAGIPSSIYSYLLRDGSIYYLTVAIVDIAFVTVATNGYVNSNTLPTLASFNSAIETTLACRLVLNLRRFGQVKNATTHVRPFTSGELQFASNRFIGNIGAPLRGMSEELQDDIDIEEEEEIDEIHSIQSGQGEDILVAEKQDETVP